MAAKEKRDTDSSDDDDDDDESVTIASLAMNASTGTATATATAYRSTMTMADEGATISRDDDDGDDDDDEESTILASLSAAAEADEDDASQTTTTTTRTAISNSNNNTNNNNSYNDNAALVSLLSHAQLFAAVEASITSTRPLVNFFYHPIPTGDAKHDNMTTRQRRNVICDIVKSSKFNKVRARRLFAGLGSLLTKVVEEEAYLHLPNANANENNANDNDNDNEQDVDGEEYEDDDGNDNTHHYYEGANNKNNHNSNSKTESHYAETSRAIVFLRCCAFLVEAYLDGVLAKQPKSRKSNNTRAGQKKKVVEVIDEVFEVAEMLHESLFPLKSCIDIEVEPVEVEGAMVQNYFKKEAIPTQSAIFGMCEKYWHGNFEDREQLVTQLIPLLLIKSLDESAQKNDVKRLYSIREALLLLDFEDASIATLEMHLLRTVGNPLFLQSADGRKFVAYLFRVDPERLVGDLHRAVRAQIPGAKRSILNAYAEIYYTAWKKSGSAAADDGNGTNSVAADDDGEDGINGQNGNDSNGIMRSAIQTSIEENALQDFMYQVIHGKLPSTVKSVRTVLDKFYANKKSPDVESMLHRMYGPLLWRALSSANAQIRKQALGVLADTFPLRDPGMDAEYTEAVVKKSVEALVKSMRDEVPSVRVEGSKATARILGLFWNAVPSVDIRRLLHLIIAKHASDASSSAVRAAAVHAVTALLKEDKTHAVLRPLLPSLGNLIHDKTEKVRLAVVNMLLLVKTIRGMKYYHVVPANHLLARLADEGQGRNNPTGSVAVGLSNLLGNSFFPTGKNKTMADIINRTLRLLSDDPHAAVTFYRNASSQFPAEAIARLIAALMKCLCYFIIEEKRKYGEDVGELSMVVPEGGEIVCKGGSQTNNIALMATIAESISILWESIEADLEDEENEHAVEVLMDVFSGNVLTEVYSHFESKFEVEEDDSLENAKLTQCFRACRAILNCAGKMDESKIDGLRAHIIAELSKSSIMSKEKQMMTNFSPNVALLCAWGMTDQVAECLASCISQYFTGSVNKLGASFDKKLDESRKRKQTDNKQGKSDRILPELDVDVCLGILGHILKGSYPASVSARESILKSETAFNAIVAAFETAKSAAELILRPHITLEAETTPAMSKHISISIEFYGRLLIHKESMKGEIPMKLTPELKSLMKWVTDTIVPSLVKLVGQEKNALRDLDLSSINMSIGSPVASPFSGDPPKRKINRNSSLIVGNLGDASFMSERGSNIFEDKAKFASTRSVLIAAMASVLHTFAEWFSLRFVGDTYISNQIAKLCKLLECSDKVVRKAILQPLFHIAITALKNDGDAGLLREVLLSLKKMDPGSVEEEMISHSMALVMSLRDESNLKAAISMIVHVIHAIVTEAEEDPPEVDSSFLDTVGVCMRKVLDSIFSEKQSSLLLAQYLVDEFKSCSVREYLFKELELRSPKTEALRGILGKWSAENGEEAKDTSACADVNKENIDANQMHIENIAA